MKETPFVSVIVLNYNGAHLLPDSLGTLLDQDFHPLEVLVVDNGSLDNSAQVAQAYPVRWIPLVSNLGFSQANNLAAQEAKGNYLFFVNNDMRFPPDCVRQLVDVLDKDPSLFAVDPTQLNWEGTRVIHGRTRFIAGLFTNTVVPPFAVEYTAPAEGPNEVPWGCAGSLLVRRDRFEALGGFDPRFFIDFEDTDLCWRAWRHGWRTVYVPHAILYHKVGMSSDEHQHLINSAQAGQLPKLWFRRRLSYHTNLVRFGLKCLPFSTAIQLIAHLMGRIGWHAYRRNLKLAFALLLACLRNIQLLPDTWAARRHLQRHQHLDHAALMARFAPKIERVQP